MISWLPCSDRWNELLQRFVTRGLNLPQSEFSAKLNACRTHIDNYTSFCEGTIEDRRVFELGTGWFPIIPVGLYLCGAAEIRSYDVVRLLRNYTFKRMLDRFCEFDQSGALKQILPWLQPERMGRLRELRQMAQSSAPVSLLESIGIQAVIGDARNTGIPSKSIDLVFSNVVLEHLSPEVISELFIEFKRIATEKAVHSHHIGIADQYSHFDRSITPFNFLKYTKSQWRWLDNPIIPLNRLLVSDYRFFLEQAGYRILKEINIPGSVKDLHSIQLAPEFQKYSEADLLVLYSYLVARPL